MISLAGGNHLLRYLAVAVGAGELVDHFTVPGEAQPCQAVEDGGDRRVGGALAVGVLDPEQHLAAGVAAIEPVEERRARPADMQEAGRRGGEAGDDGCGHRGWEHVAKAGVLYHRCGGRCQPFGTLENSMDFPEFVIRRLEPGADTELYREIRLESLKKSPESFGSDFATESHQPPEWFAERLASAVLFGAFHGDELLGIAGFYVESTIQRAHKGVLWGVYVRPKARSAGVARRLIETVLEHARSQVEQVNLIVERGNIHARRLYASLGFIEFGLEKNAIKIGDRYFDDVLMVRQLA